MLICTPSSVRNCFPRFRDRLAAGIVGRMIACGISLSVLGGCATDAINPHARNTFINSHDLIVMTDRMAADIASSSVLARLTARKPMVIALTPLVNETNSIITRGQGDAFLHRNRSGNY